MSSTRFLYNWMVALYRFVMMTVGIPGNILIFTIYWNKSIFGSAQIFIQALALCDLFSCLVMPLEIHYWLAEFNYQSNLLCKLFFTWISIGWYLSAFLTAAIAWDRYLVVCKPLKRRWTRGKAIMICWLCFALAVLVNGMAPFASGITSKQTEEVVGGRILNVSVCYQYGEDVGSVKFILATVPQYLSFMVVFVILIALYLKLWINFRNTKKVLAANQLEPFVRPAAEDAETMEGVSSVVVQSSANSFQDDHRMADVSKSVIKSKSVFSLNAPLPSKMGALSETSNATAPRSGQVQTHGKWCYTLSSIGPSSSSSKERRLERARESKCWMLMSRMSKMLLFSTFVFVITWTVTLVMYFITPSTISLSRDSGWYAVISLLRLTGLLNHVANPVVYGIINPKFRLDCFLIFRQMRKAVCGS